MIKQVKEAVSIPVIGNGDVATPEDAKRMIDMTGVDGVMIGRAALGNPWMLYRTVEYLSKGTLPPDPTIEDKMAIAMLHLDRLIKLKGESTAVKEMRKHMAWYLKGLPGAARVKDVIMETTTRDGMVRTLHDYVASVKERAEAGEGNDSETASEALVH